MVKVKNQEDSLAEVEAKQEKEMGNEAYKQKNFELALAHYDKAIKLDSTNMTYLTNKAGNYCGWYHFKTCLYEA